MKNPNYARWKSHRKGKGFSLVELVVVIIIISILAVAVFAGGAAVIAKARTERAVSDLNNFERAISTYMFEKTKMVKMDYSSGKSKFDQIADDINDGLPQEYQLDKTSSIPTTGDISSDISGQIAYVSEKKDPWGNNYWLLMDTTNRNTGSSEYFITVMSAGKNGKANVGGKLDGDDIFLLNQYSNGEVATKIYKMQEDTTDGTGSPLTKGETALTPITGLPAPRNIGDNAKDVAHVHSWVVDSQTAATCTAAGVQHRRCTACGETDDVNLPALGHNLTWTTTKQATCTENGTKRGNCTRCSYSTTETIASPGHHTYGGWTINTAATCTQAGERSRVCTVCSHKETEPIPTSGSHSWGAWTTETAATCVAGGTEKHTCTRSGCGASETRATDPLGHDWKSVTKAATCTETGYTQDECQRSGCSATQNKTTIVALGHNYGSWSTVTAATCTTGGTEKRTCTRTGCTAYETRNTDALGHSYGEWTTATAATCTAGGTEKRTCKRSGCTAYETRSTDPLEHDWKSVTVQPTESSAGYTQDECQRAGCGATQNRIDLPPLKYITFSSPTTFTVGVATKGWNGTIEYSTDKSVWEPWDGSSAISAANVGTGQYALYMRGTGNTKITGSSTNILSDSPSLSSYRWLLEGSNISCSGNIEALLDYATVANAEHPTMAEYCYAGMFGNCSTLISAPELPAATLSNFCYASMFYKCTNLKTAPSLPAASLKTACYHSMFAECSNLETVPDLTATTLGNGSYNNMFRNCTSLKIAPEISATTVEDNCCRKMFYGCSSLIKAPTTLPLPASSRGYRMYCFAQMFEGCTSLEYAPIMAEPTITNTTVVYGILADGYCFYRMFAKCENLITIPKLYANQLCKGCYSEMFSGCTKLKISETATGEYTIAYRMPATYDKCRPNLQTRDDPTDWDYEPANVWNDDSYFYRTKTSTNNMFYPTGGTFQGKDASGKNVNIMGTATTTSILPAKTYYLHSSNGIAE